MTEYLKNYMKRTAERLAACKDAEELEEIYSEHLDKIAFMQHERIVHFLVTMMFALVMAIFVVGLIMTQELTLLILITIIMVLLIFYIKHYYFLENTVQEMYRVYDSMLEKRRGFRKGEVRE